MASDKAQEDQQQHQQQQDPTQPHIPTPTTQDNKDAAAPKGLLSKLGDPAGSLLQTTLHPILGRPLEKGVTGPLGAALGGTTRPALGPLLGHADEKSEVLGGKNGDSYASGEAEKLGGREQTGGNALGLDQSGRWGFEEEGVGEGKEKEKEKGEEEGGGKFF